MATPHRPTMRSARRTASPLTLLALVATLIILRPIAPPTVLAVATTASASPTAIAAALPTATATTVAPPTPTTVAGIGGHLPTPPSTLPLATHSTDGHVAPIWPELSGIGFAVFLILVATQIVLTRPGRRGHRTL